MSAGGNGHEWPKRAILDAAERRRLLEEHPPELDRGHLADALELDPDRRRELLEGDWTPRAPASLEDLNAGLEQRARARAADTRRRRARRRRIRDGLAWLALAAATFYAVYGAAGGPGWPTP